MVDPNPDPPPLVEEIDEFRQSCCMWCTLAHVQLLRRVGGAPPSETSVAFEDARPYGVAANAFAESQGFRPYMEDRVVASHICGGQAGLYAVLDGHGLEGEGHLVSEYASKNLCSVVERHMLDAGSSATAAGDPVAARRDKFDRACTELDNRVRRTLPSYADNNGSTLVAALVEADCITFANLGDSRALLVNADHSLDFVTLDHKPTLQAEERRVVLAGGFVDDMRVNGDLAVSRTLGDVSYKPSNAPRRLCPISNEPDVTCVVRQAKHRCVVLASDGLWDALSSQEVVDVLRRHRVLELDLSAAGGAADDEAVKAAYRKRVVAAYDDIIWAATVKRLSSDNISILIALLDPMQREEAAPKPDEEVPAAAAPAAAAPPVAAGNEEDGTSLEEESEYLDAVSSSTGKIDTMDVDEEVEAHNAGTDVAVEATDVSQVALT